MKKLPFAVAALAFGLAACSSSSKASTTSTHTTPPPLAAPSDDSSSGGHKVTFRVTSADGTIDSIDWSVLVHSGIDSNRPSPYSKTTSLDGPGLVGVIATDASRVKCDIVIDGKVVDTEESDVSVNCSHTVGF